MKARCHLKLNSNIWTDDINKYNAGANSWVYKGVSQTTQGTKDHGFHL